MNATVVDDTPRIGVPRGALIGAATLIVATIVLAAVARMAGLGRTELPAPGAGSVSRAIVFQTSGLEDPITILDATTGQTVTTYGRGEGGFVRGSLRALQYERERVGLTLSGAPYQLVAWRNGRLTLDDPSTGYHIELNAFGSTNLAAFQRLLK
jgi:putative photosynthetic complex assembly protein